METAWEVGRRAWPEIELSKSDFEAFLAVRGEDDPELPVEVSRDRASDLYLAAASAAGNPAAIGAFHRELGPVIASLAARISAPGVSGEDASQNVLARLLVAGDSPPKITLYRGLGSLKSWVRAVAARSIINLNKSAAGARREVPIEQTLFDQFASGVDPELEFLKKKYRVEFKAAFSEAVAELTPRDRNYLRHLFIDQLSIDQVGVIYAIHRSTAARRLAAARESLLVRTRASLGRRLAASDDEVESIVRLIRSRWDLSISRVFRDLD